MTLLPLVKWHRAAVRFDLQALGIDLDDLGTRRLSWNRCWDFLSEILREPSSHTVSALQGDKYVPHPAERAAWSTFEAWVNTQTKKGTPYKKVKRPWAGTKPTYGQQQSGTVDTARAERRRKLDAHLYPDGAPD